VWWARFGGVIEGRELRQGRRKRPSSYVGRKARHMNIQRGLSPLGFVESLRAYGG
jgi:hypothetical protein